MFRVRILNPRRVLYEGEARSVFLHGDQGSFEILEHHKPIVSLLVEGEIIIDWEKSIAIRGGIAKMHRNEFVALVEE